MPARKFCSKKESMWKDLYSVASSDSASFFLRVEPLTYSVLWNQVLKSNDSKKYKFLIIFDIKQVFCLAFSSLNIAFETGYTW